MEVRISKAAFSTGLCQSIVFTDLGAIPRWIRKTRGRQVDRYAVGEDTDDAAFLEWIKVEVID